MTQPKKKPRKIPEKLREKVLERDNHRCQHPTAGGICDSTKVLCIHDKTHTGEHKSLHDCITLCQLHHNQATQHRRYAERIMRDTMARMKQYKTEQGKLFNENLQPA